MPEDLVVKQGSTLELTESPPPELTGAMQRVRIRTIRDLVNAGLIEDERAAEAMLTAAKEVTRIAVTTRATFTPFRPIVGTTQTDLQRYGDFRSRVSAKPEDVNIFWRVFRGVPPAQAATLSLDTDVAKYQGVSLAGIIKYFFADVTVQPYGTLVLKPGVQQLTCSALLIQKNGKIVVQGSGIKITAYSIKGEQ